MANTQLAQIIKATGPNLQLNTACASTTTAIATAEDWIRTRRCERVIVIAADNVTSPNLLQWVGSGFLVLGALTTKDKVEEAALPFDQRRSGTILGMGGIGLIIEKVTSAKNRKQIPKARIVGSHFSNSAFHASRLEPKHIAHELCAFLDRIERSHGFSRSELIKQGLIYMSHETFTNASREASCSNAEISALSSAFGDQLNDIIIANTKGYTGHSMGCAFEDVISVECLHKNILPPIANLKIREPGFEKLKLWEGGQHNANFVLRFAAGFGSQVAFVLYQKYN